MGWSHGLLLGAALASAGCAGGGGQVPPASAEQAESADCSGLEVGTVPAPVNLDLPGGGLTWYVPNPGGVAIDGAGFVAVRGPMQEYGVVDWSLFAPNGNRLKDVAVGLWQLLPQRSGFQGVASASSACGGNVWLEKLDHDGSSRFGKALIEYRACNFRNSAPDPAGGVVAAWVPYEQNEDSSRLVAQGFDDTNEPRFAPVEVLRMPKARWEGFSATIGTDLRGRTLVIWGEAEGGPSARWIEPDGTPGRTFALPGASAPANLLRWSGIEFVPLLGGGFAARFPLEGTWAWSIRSGAEQADPPPSWLAGRDGSRLIRIRAGRGYALLPPEGATACTQQIEILDAKGRACGSVNLDTRTSDCMGPVGVGADGTVFAAGPALHPNAFGTNLTLRRWPGLLR